MFSACLSLVLALLLHGLTLSEPTRPVATETLPATTAQAAPADATADAAVAAVETDGQPTHAPQQPPPNGSSGHAKAGEGAGETTADEPTASADGGESIKTADDLLRALEAADRDLRSFVATIRYTKEQGLIGDTQIRRGRVFAMRDATTGRHQFAVKFNQHILGDSVYERAQDFIFDGVWLAERDNEEKSFVRRQIVDPQDETASFDPFALDGPFPLPVGQNREAVLKRFKATLLPTDGATGRLADAWHLQLIPRNPEAREESLESVDLWYDREMLLPLKAVLVEFEGDEVSTVELASIERNADVEDSAFSTMPPSMEERRRDGWSVTIVPLERKPAADQDADAPGQTGGGR